MNPLTLWLCIIRDPRAFWRWLMEPSGEGLRQELEMLRRMDAAKIERRRRYSKTP